MAGGQSSPINFGLSENCWKNPLIRKSASKNAKFGAENTPFWEIGGTIEILSILLEICRCLSEFHLKFVVYVINLHFPALPTFLQMLSLMN